GQVVQTSGSRTLISHGEIRDCTKLNCPIGQTYLQKAAPLKMLSTTNAPAKYPTAIHAVHHGLSHKANASYAHRNSTSNKTASHLLRSQRGQRYCCGKKWRAIIAGSMKGNAREKTLLAISKPIITSPRQ